MRLKPEMVELSTRWVFSLLRSPLEHSRIIALRTQWIHLLTLCLPLTFDGMVRPRFRLGSKTRRLQFRREPQGAQARVACLSHEQRRRVPQRPDRTGAAFLVLRPLPGHEQATARVCSPART